MPEKGELDRLLDSALATYADPGVDSGLEQRLLLSLATARAAGEINNGFRRRRRWFAWAIAVPVAASLMLWVSIAKINHGSSVQNEEAHRTDGVQTPPISTPEATAPLGKLKGIHPSGAKALVHSSTRTARLNPCPVAESASAASSGTGSSSCPEIQAVSSGTNVVTIASRPKFDVFPSPQPLTAEERALVVAVQAPEPVRAALVEAPNQHDVPVDIAAIRIPPLESLSHNQP